MKDTDFINGVIRADTGAWFETHGKIWAKDRTQGIVTPKMNFLQRKIHSVIVEFESRGLPVRMVELKPRARGSTTYCVAEGYTLMRRMSTSAVFIGGQSDQTVGLWNMLKTYKQNDHFDWGNTGEVNEKGASFTNGSRAKKETAKDVQAGIGDTYQLLHATEAARWAKYGIANASEVMANILKAVPLLPKTYVFLESTAEGQCYDDQTEILTDQGWRFFKDLVGTEKILTRNQETSVAYYQDQWKFQAHLYEGPMIEFNTRTTNLKVTPNHQMWMARQKGPFKFTRADKVLGKTTDYRFQRSFIWEAPGITHITIPEYGHIQGVGYRIHPAVKIPIKPWLRFFGHWLADGHVDFKPGTKRVATTQVKYVKEFRESAQEIADIMGADLNEYKHENGFRFYIINAQLASFLKECARPKRIPRELLMNLSAKQCRDLILSIYEGDGLQDRRNNYNIDRGTVCVGIDKEFQDDLQELSLKAGYASSVFGPERNRKVTFTASRTAMVRHSNPPRLVEGYKGMTYCVTLPKDHLLMVRRGGIATWCGNSGDFYTRWLDATDAEDFLNGKDISPGDYVRVFAPWFEFDDSAIRLSPEQKREIERTLDDDEEYFGERELIELYGVTGDDGITRLGTSVTDYDVWEQLGWRRYAIRKECDRSISIFDRDFPHSWRSAFQKSGDMRFSQTGLALMRKKLATVAPKRGTLEETKDKRVVFRETPPLEARVIVFEMPIKGCRYVLGVDPMTGASQTTGADPDYHGAIVLREGYHDAKGKWNPPCTAARVVPCRWDIRVLAEPVWMLSRFYGSRTGCTIIIEMNQDKGLTELLRQKGANFYRREVFNQMEQKTTKQFGFQTNEKTREMLVEKVATAIRGWDEEGGGIDIWSEDALTQCENFVRKANGRSEAAEGFKDDDVFAIGLALIGIPQGTTYYPAKPLPGWGEPPLQRHDGQETTAGAFT